MKVIDVVDVNKVPALLTRSVNDRRLALQELHDEGAHNRRNRAPIVLGAPVDAEVAKRRHRQPVRLLKTERKKPFRLLAERVKAFRRLF